MENPYLRRLNEQYDELRASSESILQTAVQENRELTQSEAAAVEGSYREMERVRGIITPLQAEEQTRAQFDAERAKVEQVRALRTNQLPSHGQLERYRDNIGGYLADWGAQRRDPAARERIVRAQAEWRVVADQKLADNPGIVPTPILGDVTNQLPILRPFIASIRNLPMPSGGATFLRPKITQHAAVGAQSAEKTQLASQKLTITSTTVTKKTYGGTLDISFQDRDWTDPAILSIAVNDLASLYANETDNNAADSFLAAVTGNFVLIDAPADGAVRSAIMNASAQIFANVKQRPDTVWMSPDEYSKYGAMTNSAGGQVSFPGLQDATTDGGVLMGLRVVVDGNFAAKTMIIGCSQFVEHYETVGGLLSVEEPTILGYTIAYYGYVADVLVDAGAALKRSAT